MDADAKAKAEGLSLKSADYRQTCPKCSPNRIKKKDPCLHVTVSRDEIKAYCHHCGWGAIFDDDQRRDTYEARSPRPGRRDGFSPGPRKYATRGW